MIKTLKGILFLLNVGFIFGTELLLYVIFRDYSFLIDRLSMRLSSVNILYVKVFQAFALNNSLIDDKTKQESILYHPVLNLSHFLFPALEDVKQEFEKVIPEPEKK